MIEWRVERVEESSWFEEGQEGLLEGSEELGGLSEGLEGSDLEGADS